MVNIAIIGVAGAINEIKRKQDEKVREMNKALNKGANLVRNDAVKSIMKFSAGDPYFNRERNRWTIAAKKGDAPNNQTGRLSGSIVIRRSGGGRVFEVGTATSYAKKLETGDHPFLSTALEDNREKINDLIREALRK